MATPPAPIQALLLTEVLGLLASYSWQSTVTLEPTEFGHSDADLTVPEFFREFQLRHAIATGPRLAVIIAAIESNPSHLSGIERTESRGVIRGRLDTLRYLSGRATLRSLPRRYPIVRRRLTYGTLENVLACMAIGEVRAAMRDNPFPVRYAETTAATNSLRWATDRLRHRPWDEIAPHGLRERLRNEVEARVRRRQTGNDGAYRQLLDWYDEWLLDLHQLGPEAQDRLVRGLLAFPAGEAFWDKVFEVWCLLFVASALDSLDWERLEGPVALHLPSRVIYRYRTPAGQTALVRFQRKEPLPLGRWRYRDGPAVRGIPDITVSVDGGPFAPLLIDAKNRYVVVSERLTRPEETYKMLGYAENFGSGTATERFRGVLIFPANRTTARIIDGPGGGRLDLVAVNLTDDRSHATAALARAIAAWITEAPPTGAAGPTGL
jgi:hypothetical protein